MKRIALTCGDPAGVGPEVIERWLRSLPQVDRDLVVIGPTPWLAGLPLHDDQLISVGQEEYVAVPGQPDGESALVAWAAMERAAAGCGAGEFAGVVTGPVSKARLAQIGYAYPGQTEFFAAHWRGTPTMAFCGGKLRVVLLTWHIPLREVPAHLTFGNVERTVLAAVELARAEGISAPRVGVCGLNPHAGEDGLLGTEERDLIDPMLDRLRLSHPGVSRCQPGDTLFVRALRGEFDVVVALYHDQGLAPLKVVDFDESVNVTLGLSHVRTSPDHGTAFSIAGKGLANARSFANAVGLAKRLVALRAGGNRA
ncbi:MAG: 4-hydroxythreonine-4-phosphate dehydrogenase PdxA [Opitutaceae bacterium]